MRPSNVCVYCGSSPGNQPVYAEQARALARALVERDIGLVYGGGRVGIMGIIADSVLSLGGRVIGIIPQALLDREVAHLGLSELIVTSSMHERKTRMVERADAFVALPGGLGTLEELFEVWTWAQLGIHEKPCGILDVAGYYAGLVGFVDHAVAEGFVKPANRAILIVERDPEVLLARFEQYVSPGFEKWVRPEQS
jgi:uncharacterized protein (TIGR00730 family)